MSYRQTGIPSEWLIVDSRLTADVFRIVRYLPRCSGVLVLHHDLGARERRALLTRLRRIAQDKRLKILDEARGHSARVHNMGELRRALTANVQLLFLSPIFRTRSHPDWRQLPRMRAATLARLPKRSVMALGGMDRRRFRTIQKLGFAGWAGLDAWTAS